MMMRILTMYSIRSQLRLQQKAGGSPLQWLLPTAWGACPASGSSAAGRLSRGQRTWHGRRWSPRANFPQAPQSLPPWPAVRPLRRSRPVLLVLKLHLPVSVSWVWSRVRSGGRGRRAVRTGGRRGRVPVGSPFILTWGRTGRRAVLPGFSSGFGSRSPCTPFFLTVRRQRGGSAPALER